MVGTHCGTHNNEAPGKRRSRAKHKVDERARIELFDLRRAMSGDDRFARLALAITSLRRDISEGIQAHVIWPADHDVAIAGALLGRPLANCIAGAPGPGSVVIHMKSGSVSSFLGIPARSSVRIVMHVNCDVAAMKWEPNDAPPIRRLAAASRLAKAGWNTEICVGPVRLYKGHRTDYRELFENMKSFRFHTARARFVGEDFRAFIGGNSLSFSERSSFTGFMTKCLAEVPKDLLAFSRAA